MALILSSRAARQIFAFVDWNRLTEAPIVEWPWPAEPVHEPSEERLEQLKSAVALMVETGAIHPWCGICRSRDWHYDTGKTRYRTLAEAEGPLRAAEVDQARSREFFKASRN